MDEGNNERSRFPCDMYAYAAFKDGCICKLPVQMSDKTLSILKAKSDTSQVAFTLQAAALLNMCETLGVARKSCGSAQAADPAGC